MTTNKVDQYKITELQNSVAGLRGEVQNLKENHLAHLKDDINTVREDVISLKARLNVVTAINIGGIVLGLLATKFLK